MEGIKTVRGAEERGKDKQVKGKERRRGERAKLKSESARGSWGVGASERERAPAPERESRDEWKGPGGYRRTRELSPWLSVAR